MRTVGDIVDTLDTIYKVRRQLLDKAGGMTGLDDDIIDLLNGYEEVLKDLKIAK